MKKRPLVTAVLIFLVGTYLGSVIPWVIIPALALGVVAYVCRQRSKEQIYPMLLAGLVLASIGMLNGYRLIRPDPFRDRIIQMQQEAQVSATFSGRVARIERGKNSVSYQIDTASLRAGELAATDSYTILVYASEELEEVWVGSMVTGEITLEYPSRRMNPGQFDALRYYSAKGITFLGFCESMEAVDAYKGGIPEGLRRLRYGGEDLLLQGMDPEAAYLLSGMLLGDRSGIERDMVKIFQACGVSHVLAISALHISILGNLIYSILRRLRAPKLVCGIGAGVLLGLYGVLTGGSISTIRAILMFLLYIGADLKDRTYDVYTALAISLLFLLIGNPARIYDAGFQMSYGCVFALGVVAPVYNQWILRHFPKIKKHRYKRQILSFIKGTCSIVSLQLITGPLTMYHYYTYPTYGFLLNLVVVPLMTPILILGLLGLLLSAWNPGWGIYYLWPVNLLLKLLMGLCSKASALPGAVIHTGALPLVTLLSYYGFLYCMTVVLCREKMGKGSGNSKIRWKTGIGVCGIVLTLAVFLVSLTGKAKTTVVMLSVGQGDCFLVRTEKGSVCLIDGGSSSEREIGKYILAPALAYYGTDRIDLAFVSHMDGDHYNGIAEILADPSGTGVRIDTLVLPAFADACSDFDPLRNLAASCGTQIRYLDQGDGVCVDELRFCCLYPDRETLRLEGRLISDNDTSMVLSLHIGRIACLFTGDLGEEAEPDLCEYLHNAEVASETYMVLKVGHHGSKYSTTEELLCRLHAKIALISCGAHNSYGHPHEELVQRLEDVGCDLFRTDQDGAVIIDVHKNRLRVTCFAEYV